MIIEMCVCFDMAGAVSCGFNVPMGLCDWGGRGV